MARPLKEETPLEGIVSTRLQGQDYQEFITEFQKSGLSRSEYLRKAVLRRETTIVAVEKKTGDDQRQKIFLMKKSSNNLNQLAHQANAAHKSGKISEALYKEILSSLDIANRQMKAFL